MLRTLARSDAREFQDLRERHGRWHTLPWAAQMMRLLASWKLVELSARAKDRTTIVRCVDPDALMRIAEDRRQLAQVIWPKTFEPPSWLEDAEEARDPDPDVLISAAARAPVEEWEEEGESEEEVAGGNILRLPLSDEDWGMLAEASDSLRMSPERLGLQILSEGLAGLASPVRSPQIGRPDSRTVTVTFAEAEHEELVRCAAESQQTLERYLADQILLAPLRFIIEKLLVLADRGAKQMKLLDDDVRTAMDEFMGGYALPKKEPR
jgi:hypothetical protein